MGEETSAQREWLKCRKSPLYFIHTYCQIYDATSGSWIPFTLWTAQASTLQTIHQNNLTIILKARQLGLTWLVLGYVLWLMVYQPSKTCLLFSRRDDEAIYLLERLRGMYKRLPVWSQVRQVRQDSAHVWELSNGSIAYAFPTTAGDSYTASIAVVDEADLVPDLDRLMNAVKPTIDGGGRMILLSRTDKANPSSPFKRIYRAARAGESPWVPVFLPWHVRPERDQEWYNRQKDDILTRTGSLDDLYQQYPATENEALAARVLDKRIPPAWIARCAEEALPTPLDTIDAPALPSFRVYRPPERGYRYVIGIDPAEGNPTSDPSALVVLNEETLEEVACMHGQIEPTMIASYAIDISDYYHNAGILVERNNHGHSVIAAIREQDHGELLLRGWDDKPGWLSSSRGKVLLYNHAADAFRDGITRVHTPDLRLQLESIEGDTLRAPEGLHDDLADAFSLALAGASFKAVTSVAYSYV